MGHGGAQRREQGAAHQARQHIAHNVLDASQNIPSDGAGDVRLDTQPPQIRLNCPVHLQAQGALALHGLQGADM